VWPAVGRVRENIARVERARVKDPLNFLSYFGLSELLAMSGDIDRALAVNAAGLALPGYENNPQLRGSRLLLLLAKGDRASIAAYRDQAPVDEDRSAGNLELIGLLDQPDTALQVLRNRAENPALSPQALGVLSAWAAYFGDANYALELLRRRFALSISQSALIFRPLYADTRKLAGFKDLVNDLGLVDYWRTTGNWGDFCRPLAGNDDFECF
jgi:hypothetical protein